MNNSLKLLRRPILAFAVVAALGFAGCEDEPVGPEIPGPRGTKYGAAVNVGHGKGRGFVTFDDKGTPTEIGLALDEAALTGLPTDTLHTHGHPTFYEIPLPADASATPFNHIGLHWNPVGHEPDGIYNLPHFDLHFYMITPQQRDAITAIGADTIKCATFPEPKYRPAGYVPGPGYVPTMGTHWIDPTSPEFTGKPFTRTFIYGSYDGRMNFMEPMITKAYLESKPNATEELKLPQYYRKTGYYPTNYTVRYNEATHEYLVTLGGMKLRYSPEP